MCTSQPSSYLISTQETARQWRVPRRRLQMQLRVDGAQLPGAPRGGGQDLSALGTKAHWRRALLREQHHGQLRHRAVRGHRHEVGRALADGEAKEPWL